MSNKVIIDSDVRVHRFNSTGEAYNASQTRDEIRDGDVLLVDGEREEYRRDWRGEDAIAVIRERVVGILVSAWPTALDASRPTGEFHALADGLDWETFEGGRYAASARLARQHEGSPS